MNAEGRYFGAASGLESRVSCPYGGRGLGSLRAAPLNPEGSGQQHRFRVSGGGGRDGSKERRGWVKWVVQVPPHADGNVLRLASCRSVVQERLR